MRDVYALRSELATEGLGEGAHGEFAGGEGGAEGGTFEGGCCAGEDEGWWVFWRRGGFEGFEEEREGGLGEEVGSFAVWMYAISWMYSILVASYL